MATEQKFEIYGLKETLDLFRQLQDEIGDKKARSKVLLPALKEAMKPVLYAAKNMAASNESNLLQNSLMIMAKRPNARDRKSIYITSTDTVVCFVTTKPIPKKLKTKFRDTTARTSQSEEEYNKQRRAFYEANGYHYDARAVANEFGTAKRPAKPFLRPALEYQAQNVTTLLGMILKRKIEQYRSKNAK
jgi:hypothetical protein